MTKYRIQGGGEVVLTQSDFLAGGGEGNVYVHGNKAFKIYTNPKHMIPERKISELSTIKLNNVIRPLDILLDPKKQPVGYSMRYLSNTHPLCRVFTQAFKDREGVDGPTVMRLVKCLKDGVIGIHDAGILVVDLNEMNFLIDKAFTEVFFIDVDSYQTPTFPATAIMESIKDPHAGGKWSKDTDWYSFGIISFQLFTGIHPYKGKHPDIKTFQERMLKNVSVFNKDVSVPKVVPKFGNVIPKTYLDWYKAVFEDGNRFPPPDVYQAPVFVVVAAPITSSDSILITQLHNTAERIIQYTSRDGRQLAILLNTNGNPNAWWYDGRIHHNLTTPYHHTGQAIITEHGDPLYAWLELNSDEVHVCNLVTGRPLSITLSGQAIQEYQNRLYVHYNDMIMELKTDIAGIVAPQVIARVLPNATKLYRGVAIQNVLGTYYANAFPDSGKSIQFDLSELKGYRVIDARCEGHVLMVVGEKQGKYTRWVMIWGNDASHTIHSTHDDIAYTGLNFVASDYICAQIDEEENLLLFVPGTAKQKVVKSSSLSGDMRLVLKDKDVCFTKDCELYRLQTVK